MVSKRYAWLTALLVKEYAAGFIDEVKWKLMDAGRFIKDEIVEIYTTSRHRWLISRELKRYTYERCSTPRERVIANLLSSLILILTVLIISLIYVNTAAH